MKNLKIAALIFLLGLEVFAIESIGRVVKVHGEVMNNQNGSSVALKRGDDLYVGSNIVSGKSSFVKIFMKDDTIFQLGPNSEFLLEKFEFTTKAERTAVYKLAKGKLRSLFTVKAPTRSLKIKTPTASMGVRGTEILSDVYRFKGKLTTDIALLSGSLEVQTKGIQKRMLIKPGFVYQSSLNDSLKRNAISSKIRRMDKRVFSRAKKSKDRKNVFLSDVRRKIDKKLVKDVKFEIINTDSKKKRLPASKDKTKLKKKKFPKGINILKVNMKHHNNSFVNNNGDSSILPNTSGSQNSTNSINSINSGTSEGSDSIGTLGSSDQTTKPSLGSSGQSTGSYDSSTQVTRPGFGSSTQTIGTYGSTTQTTKPSLGASTQTTKPSLGPSTPASKPSFRPSTQTTKPSLGSSTQTTKPNFRPSGQAIKPTYNQPRATKKINNRLPAETIKINSTQIKNKTPRSLK